MTASSVIQFPTNRAAAAMPVNKLRVQEQVRQLVRENVMPRSALFVVVYLGEITGRESGLATVELGTIADRTGYSRGAVGHAIKFLVYCGRIERTSRRRGKRCLAAAFRLADPVGSKNSNLLNDADFTTEMLTDQRAARPV